MLKSAGIKTFFVYIVAHALAMCPTFVHANGGAGNADGNVCSGTLMEQDEAKWGKSFTPGHLAAFSEIAPVIQLAKEQLPEFYNDLQKALSKKWSFGFGSNQFHNDGFVDCPPENSYSFAISKNNLMKVACQTSTEVIINPTWFEKLNSQACKDLWDNDDRKKALEQMQKALIVKELLLGITIGRNYTQYDTNRVFTAFMRSTAGDQIKARDLQHALEESGFGPYRLVESKTVREVPCDPTIDSLPKADPAISAALAAISKTLCGDHGKLVNGVCAYPRVNALREF